MATSYNRLRPRSDTALEIESLLGRYPRLSQQELAKLIELMPDLPMLDQVLITADDRLAAKLAHFLRDHRNKLKAPFDALAQLAFPAVLAGLALWWVLSL